MLIKNLPQYKEDCQRYARIIATATDDDIKLKLHNLYKDFRLKAENLDQGMEDAGMGFSTLGIGHKEMVEEFKKVRLNNERYITSLGLF